MSSETTQIPNDKNIVVASNEMFLRATINRNLEKLLQNDEALYKKIAQYGANADFSIQLYMDTKDYKKGEVVLYCEKDSDGRILTLYLLECIEDSPSAPSYVYIDGYVKDFSKSGWKDANPFFAIYNSSDSERSLSSFLAYAISGKFHEEHELDLTKHKYGAISESSLSSKLLLKDFSNIADSRKSQFWAYEIGKVSYPNCTGVYKKWGNGLLEYDLTFSLTCENFTEKTIGEDGSIKTTSCMKANTFIPLSSATFNNDDYFLGEEDYTIFNKQGSDKKNLVNGQYQTNINKQSNAYHGKISFPTPFIDSNYMVFVRGAAADSSGRSQSPNSIVFSDKQSGSMVALLVIPNYNSLKSVDAILLKNNSFQCQIIGRWK